MAGVNLKDRGMAAADEREFVIVDGSNDANWTELTGAGVTKTTDYNVLYEGQPTTRFFIPGALSTNFQIGTIGATALFPNWDGIKSPQRYGVIFRASDISRVTTWTLFVGDSSLTNYYNGGPLGKSSIDWPSNEWIASTKGTPTWTITGSPSWSGLRRTRLRFTVTAGADMYIWVAKLTVAPFARPAVILSFDDGYDEMYTFLKPACEARNIPCSFSIDAAYVGTAGYMTEAQILEMANNPKNLFEFVTHGYANGQYSTIGLNNYIANNEVSRNWLKERGITTTPDVHIYVGGSYDATLAAAMKSRGIIAARNTNGLGRYQHPFWDIRDAGTRLAMQLGAKLDNTESLTQVKAYVDAAIAAGQLCIIIGHRIDAAAGVIQWAEADVLALLDYLVAKRTTGLLDIHTYKSYLQSAQGTRCLRI